MPISHQWSKWQPLIACLILNVLGYWDLFFFQQNYHPLNTVCMMCRTSVGVKASFVAFKSLFFKHYRSDRNSTMCSCNLLLHQSFSHLQIMQGKLINLSLALIFSFSFFLPLFFSKIILGYQAILGISREKYPEYFPFKT